MDIPYSQPYPRGALSSGPERRFAVVDGEPCSSMERFIQSLKFERAEGQRRARFMSGMEAKRFGSARAQRWMGLQALWRLGAREWTGRRRSWVDGRASVRRPMSLK